MRVESVTLYKTPLDNNYTNIIDIEDNTSNVFQSYVKCLDEFYKPLKVVLSNVKSIKIDNKKGIIILNYDYLTLRNYNYININNKFFFITSLTSLNDSETNPSTQLIIEWDSYGNNIEILHRNNIKNNYIANTITRHRSRFRYDKKPIYYKNENIGELPTIETEIYEPRILFAKITFNKDIETLPTTETDGVKAFEIENPPLVSNDITIASYDKFFSRENITPLNNRYTIYVPLGLFRLGELVEAYVRINNEKDILYTDGNKNVEVRVTYDLSTFNNKDKFKLPLTSYDLNYSFGSKDLIYVDSIEYTYNSPYFYNVDDNNIITFDNPLLFLKTDTLKYFDAYESNILGLNQTNIIPFLGKVNSFVGYENIDSDSRTFYYDNKNNYVRFNKGIEDIEIDYNIRFDCDYNSSLDVYDNYDKDCDPKMNIYPFKYITLIIGTEKFIISPEKFYDYIYTIRIDNSSLQPYFSLLCNRSYILNKRGLPINNSGSISYTINALDDYLIRNGNQKETSIQLSKLNALVNLLTTPMVSFNKKGKINSINYSGMVQPFTSVLGTVSMQDALEKDLRQTPSTVVKSDYAENDLIYQDRPIIIQNKVYDIQALETYKYNLYLYGYTINAPTLVLNNDRYWFDYVNSECYIVDITDEYDRNVINDIYTKGVFRYHCHIDNNGNIKDFDNLFKKDYSLNNIERSLLEE